MIKKITGWPTMWALFYIGHWLSIPGNHWPWERFHPYRIWNWFLVRSMNVQDWAGFKDAPWKVAP